MKKNKPTNLITSKKGTGKSSHPKHEESPIRRSRHMGITNLCIQLNRTNNKELERELKDKIIRLHINDWLHNNFNLLGKQVTMEQLAELLGISTKVVLKQLTGPLDVWLGNQDTQQLKTQLLSYAFKMASSDRALCEAQVANLSQIQAIALENSLPNARIYDSMNGAISSLQNNTKHIFSVLSELLPKTPKIAIQNLATTDGSQATSPNNKYLGTTEAVKLLENQRTKGLLEDIEAQDALFEDMNLEALPEIIATKQQGLSADGTEIKAKDNKPKKVAKVATMALPIIP